MFGNFTEEARQIIVKAKKEMYELKHPYVGSEHLLLAILKDNNQISKKLKEYKPDIIVADTVMVSTSGCMLIEEEAKRVLSKELFPIADIITPNVPEAEVLSGIEIRTENDMEKAAEILSKNNKAVLIKGGHMAGEANDLLRVNHQNYWYKAMRVNNDNTHGTGCTLSSAIACEMADGKDICDAVKAAKRYVYHAISAGLNLGNGSGPLWHDVD